MRLTFSTRLAVVVLAAVLLGPAACSDNDDPTGPTVSQVAGDYVATRLTATALLVTRDILRDGGSLRMQFAASGELTGHLTVPSESVDEEFAGTWRIDDGEIEIEQVAADVFVEDLTFKRVGNTLVADEIFDGVRVRATLTKQ